MRTFYTPPENFIVSKACTYVCDHPLYSRCTLYLSGDLGLAVVQKRFNPKAKIFFWSQIDQCLVDDIYGRDKFQAFFLEHAGRKINGLYPTVNVRKLMWALSMPPLPLEYFEKFT